MADVSFDRAFLTSHPKQGLQAVLDKQRLGSTLDDELAQYFKERAAIEDQYAKNLVRASKRLFVLDKSAFGAFLPVWELLLNELTEISTAHGVLSYKIVEQIEHALKTPPCPDADKIRSMEPSFHHLAKEYESASKAKTGKGSLFKSSKTQPDKLMAKWTRDAPAFLQLCENVERARMERWKALVTQFEQDVKEQLDKRQEIASATLAAATSYNVDADIQQFCASQHFATVSATVSSASSQHTDHPPSGPAPAAIAPAAALSPASTTSPSSLISPASGTPPRRPSTASSQETAPQPAKSKLKSRFSLLRKAKRPMSMIQRDPSISAIPEHEDDAVVPVASRSTSTNGHASPAALSRDSDVHDTGLESRVSHASHDASTQAHHSPPVDAEGYSIPFPDRGLGDAPAQDMENHSGFASITPSTSSQRFKFDIKHESIRGHEQEKETATLTRVSSMLRETTPTISQRRRGRRQNMRVQSVMIDQGPPSPLSIGHADTVSTTTSTESASNPFRQSTTPTTATTDQFTASPSSTTATSLAGLHATVREVVTVTADQQAHVHGQILLSGGQGTSPAWHGRIQHNGKHALALETISPVAFLQSDAEKSTGTTLFSVPSSALLAEKPMPMFSYRYDMPLDAAVPLVLRPSWKISDTNVMLMVKYHVAHPTLLEHGRLIITVKLENATVHQAQSTPEGIWDQQHAQFTWRSSELVPYDQQQTAALGNTHAHRLLAKFTITPTTQPPAIQPSISLKYACRNHLLTSLFLAAAPSSVSSNSSNSSISPNPVPTDYQPLLVDEQWVKSEAILLD
ncbi:hypothetical protein BC940DRAFT_316650 [Gongronella butleri]|nr:hypothetical protein BC940DRAFT_316650 [Gongronella butleri]